MRTSPSYLGHQLQSAPGRCGCPVVAAAALLNSGTQLHAPHKACTCFSWVAPGKGDHCREMFVLVPCLFGAEAPSRTSATVDVSEPSPPRMPMGTSLKLATYQHLVFRTRSANFWCSYGAVRAGEATVRTKALLGTWLPLASGAIVCDRGRQTVQAQMWAKSELFDKVI